MVIGMREWQDGVVFQVDDWQGRKHEAQRWKSYRAKNSGIGCRGWTSHHQPDIILLHI
jgi:hypothetical protein